MYVKHGQEIVFDVFKDGKLFRSFPTRGNALAYISAARELCPLNSWALVVQDVTCDLEEVSGND